MEATFLADVEWFNNMIWSTMFLVLTISVACGTILGLKWAKEAKEAKEAKLEEYRQKEIIKLEKAKTAEKRRQGVEERRMLRELKAQVKV